MTSRFPLGQRDSQFPKSIAQSNQKHGSLKKQHEEMLLGERHQVSAAEAAILFFFVLVLVLLLSHRRYSIGNGVVHKYEYHFIEYEYEYDFGKLVVTLTKKSSKRTHFYA